MTRIAKILVAAGLCLSATSSAQKDAAPTSLHARPGDAVFTTVCAPMERATFTLDKGYHLAFNDPAKPLSFNTDKAGSWELFFVRGADTVRTPAEMFEGPAITRSFPDLIRYTCKPFKEISAEVTFLAWSSQAAMQQVTLTSGSKKEMTVSIGAVWRCRPLFHFEDDLEDTAVTAMHREMPDRWTMDHEQPFVDSVRDCFLLLEEPDAVTTRHGMRTVAPGALSLAVFGPVQLAKQLRLAPGAKGTLHFARSFGRMSDCNDTLLARARVACAAEPEKEIARNERLFAAIPKLKSGDSDIQTLYRSAFTLLRQCMLPPEGACARPYYVFSREPQWGWGHGGQVFHESMSMLAYALLDPKNAMESQRIYRDRQQDDGYINYRAGPYLDERIVTDGGPTSSAPLYAWINWEVYTITKDRTFLQEMYTSSTRFHDWYTTHRDTNRDGLAEWGGDAVLESLRDSEVALWDQVGDPKSFEALDLNVMLCSEEVALADMAAELKRPEEAQKWTALAATRAGRINALMWDEETGFYYHIDKSDHDFTLKNNDDIKRREIIGFLPLWAGIAGKEQAARLVKTLTDTAQFWRAFGVPSLSASDPFYAPHGYWNGPVWVQWNYFVLRGLLRYGYRDEARELLRRVASGMIAQLRTTNTFWEFISPDDAWGGKHQTYIWAGLIARMLLDADIQK